MSEAKIRRNAAEQVTSDARGLRQHHCDDTLAAIRELLRHKAIDNREEPESDEVVAAQTAEKLRSQHGVRSSQTPMDVTAIGTNLNSDMPESVAYSYACFLSFPSNARTAADHVTLVIITMLPTPMQ